MHDLKHRMMGGAAIKAAPLAPTEAPRASTHHRKAGYSQDEIDGAYAALMTGPKATRPRWKTIRRTILLTKNKIKHDGSGRNLSYRKRVRTPAQNILEMLNG